MTRGSFTNLKIWLKGIELADVVYEITATYPKEERYGLTAQSRGAAVSIPSNIAEGSQRTTDKDFANFVRTAKGSLAELFTQMMIADRRKYFTQEQKMTIFMKIDELDKMIFSFLEKLTVHNS